MTVVSGSNDKIISLEDKKHDPPKTLVYNSGWNTEA